MDITRREPTRKIERLSPEGRDDSPETGKPKDRPGGPILGRRPPTMDITPFVDDDDAKPLHIQASKESPIQEPQKVSTGIQGDAASEKKVQAQLPGIIQTPASGIICAISNAKVPESPMRPQKATSMGNGSDTAREKERPQESPKQEQMAASTGDVNYPVEAKKLQDVAGGQKLGRRQPTTDITPFVDDDESKPQHIHASKESPKQDVSVASAGQSSGSAGEKKPMVGRPGDPGIDRRPPTMVVEKPPVDVEEDGPIVEPPIGQPPQKEHPPIPLERVISKGRRIYMYTLLLVASFLGVFTINQTVSFVSRLSALPLLVSIPLGIAMVAFLGIIIYFMCKVLRAFFKLKQSPQVSLMPISPVEGRRRMQELCGQRNKEARNLLYKTLKEIDSKAYADALEEIDISSDSIRNLARVRRELCDSHERNRTSSQEWLRDFKQYQAMVDGIAEERIKSHSYKCAIAATASRIPAMDRFIVLSSMFAMCKDLLVIYNLKPSRFNIAILMARIIINTFCAGYVQNVAEEAGKLMEKAVDKTAVAISTAIGGAVGSLGGPLGTATGASVGAAIGAVIGKSGGLATEFTAYVLLMKRLGKATQKMLQPLAEG